MGVICGTTDVSEAVRGLFRHLPSETVQRRASLSRDMSAIKLVTVSAVGLRCGGDVCQTRGGGNIWHQCGPPGQAGAVDLPGTGDGWSGHDAGGSALGDRGADQPGGMVSHRLPKQL
jgi:hypothetical protein